MKLYLLRHAQPKPESEDPQKSLSAEGISQMKKISTILGHSNGLTVESIYHSPKTRARQTAELIAKIIRSKNGIMETDGLTPHDDPGIWAKRIGKMRDDIILTGHLPHLGRLTALLLTERSEREIVDFHPATLVCLARSGNNWSLEWVINPNL